MRICLCISYFPPAVGGAEHQTARLAAGLAARGDEVTVVTRRLAGAPTREMWQGVEIHRSIRPGSRGVLFGLGYTLSLFGFLLRHGHRFEVVQAVGIHLGAYVACQVSRRMGFPVVVRPTGMGPDGDLGKLNRMPFWPLWRGGDAPTRRHVQRAIRKADAFVALNRDMAAELADHQYPAERIVQIRNGVPVGKEARDPAVRRATRDRLGLPEGPILLFVGRLNPHKGPGRLLRILPRLVARHPTLTLVFLGDGPQRRELVRLAAELEVAAHVRWLGERPDSEEFYRAADIFALPSEGEGMSNALLEAMAAGLPCVATRVTGNVEVVTDRETGLLVALEDPNELAWAIGCLLEDDALRARIGRAAWAHIQEAYSVERMVAAYRDLYGRLLRGRTGDKDARGPCSH